MADTAEDHVVARLEAVVHDLLLRVDALEAENQRLRATTTVSAPDLARSVEPSPTEAVTSGPVSRRKMLLGGAGAAAVGAAALVAGTASPAAANGQGQSFTLGDTGNTATNSTGLTGNYNDRAVLQATNNGTASAFLATLGTPPGGANTAAVVGQSTASRGVAGASVDAVGVAGTSTSSTGVFGTSTSSTGVSGTSTSSTGVYGVAGPKTGYGRTGGVVGDSAFEVGVGGLSLYTSGVHGFSVTSAGVFGGSGNGTGASRKAGVIGDSNTEVGVVGQSGVNHGVYGVSGDPAPLAPSAAGVVGTSVQGVGVVGFSKNQMGVLGQSVDSVSAVFQGDHGQLLLSPATSRPAPTADGFSHSRGELLVDSTGDLWYCTAGGTPGTWRKLSGPAAAGSFHVLPQPARMYDSRPGTSPSQGPKAKLSTIPRTLDCTVNNSGVPVGATAVALTVLLVDAVNGSSNMTIWANGAPKPASNTMVWGAGSGRYTSSTISAVDADAKIQVSGGSTNLVLDIVGYYA